MAGIKYLLQKEVFDESNERILSVCNVQKLYKKKKNSYLCVAIAARSHPTLVQIKQSDKGVYRKKRIWQLTEIKSVDGKNDSTTEPVHEFDIVCEKQYKWFAANPHERQNLLTVLHKQINKFIKIIEQRATFTNIPFNWLQESSPEKIVQAEQLTDGGNESVSDDEFEDFHALTEKEENELNKLMENCDLIVTNAEQFMDQLSQNLQDLDGANVQSVLASEKQVNALMTQIELAITEADRVETRLNEYDEILCHVRDAMEKMGEKNAMIEVANNNNIKLLNELDGLVSRLDLPYAHQIALTETDLTTPQGLSAAIVAGRALQNAMNADLDSALQRLTSVQDQQKRFEKWRAKFSQTISRHLNNMFIHLANDLGESQLAGASVGGIVQINDLVLTKHSNVHKELNAYCDLMHWIKAMDRKTYDGLSKVYTASMSKVYEREIRHFFEMARASIVQQFTDFGEMNTSMTGKFKSPQSTKQVSQPWGILGVNKELWSNGIDANERQRFDSILEKVLAELEPVALSEQNFCVRFFELDVLSPTARGTALDGSMTGSITEESGSQTAPVVPQRKVGRQMNDDVRRMITVLFNILEPELNSFILSFEKLDSL